ncbi:hypothetical protein J6590_030834 [Homalodisca vitripennis]|nr:hypothetical protein J6590_030834 [Homalodisca vitripennis]
MWVVCQTYHRGSTILKTEWIISLSGSNGSRKVCIPGRRRNDRKILEGTGKMVLWKVILSVVLALSVTLSATSAPVEYESQEESGLQEEENEYQDENQYQDRNEYNSMTSEEEPVFSYVVVTDKYMYLDPPTLPPT